MNIPKLRFKDNNGNNYPQWEKKKLGDISDIRDGTHDSPKYINNGYPLITSKNIQNGKISFDNINYISKEDYDNINKRSNVSVGDIIMGMIGTIGNVALLSEENFAIKNVALFKEKTLLKNIFLIQYLQSDIFYKSISNLNEGGTQKFISLKNIRNLYINIPFIEEQEKIANFLIIVDKKIENLENTITSLENQKKGLLQQIFSQKLRFKDENGNNYPNWEKKKLGDIATLKNGISKSNEAFGHGKKFINLQDIFNKSYIFNGNYSLVDVTEKELSENNLLKGDVLFVRSSVKREGVGLPCVIMENLIDTVYSGFIIRCRFNINENIYLHYKKYCFLEFSFRKALLKKSSSSANTNINQDNLSKLYVKLPCLEEQTKIADFLSAFDRKLDNQKAQLEHWQQIKKGLLQQMFV